MTGEGEEEASFQEGSFFSQVTSRSALGSVHVCSRH